MFNKTPFKSSVLALVAALAMPHAAKAAVDCDAINALSRISDTVTSHNNWPVDQVLPNGLRRDFARFNQSNIRHLFEEYPDAQAIQTLENFGQTAQRIAQLARSNRGADIHLLLQSPAIVTLFDDAKDVLDQLGCNGPRAAAKTQPDTVSNASAQGGASDGLTEVSTGLGLVVSSRPILLIICFLVLVAVCFASILIRQRSVAVRRKRRRFVLNQSVEFCCDGPPLNGRILDISCFGTKLHHYGQLPTDDQFAIQILLNNKWRDATVKWANDHYAGLAFDTPLSRASVFQILKSKQKDKAPPAKKTTPARAPSLESTDL